MRHSWVFVFLFGCSLVANTDDFRFDDTPDVGDDAADTGPDTDSGSPDTTTDADAGMDGDTVAPECNLDSECDPLPHQPGRCVDGVCTNTDCEDGYADCDGVADNGCEADTRVDSANCGECGLSCAIDRTVTTCEASECEFVMCDPGFDDCEDTVPGCESDLSDPATCGSCTPCAEATPLCDNTGDSPVCVADCPGGTTLCGTSRCVDLTMDIGACGDCDTVCDDVAGSSPSCMDSSCGFSCDDDRGDCDDGEGCETDTSLSVDHCGGCDMPCEGGSAMWACSDSSCVVTTCTDGMQDCNDGALGCESDPMTDAMNCGGCDIACDAGDRCIDGVCNGVIDVSTFARNGCAVRDSGQVYCWGLNRTAQLGDGTLTHSGLPVEVQDADSDDPLVAQSVTVGEEFICALDVDGAIWCWGRNGYGELSDGTRANKANPTRVIGETGFDDRTFIDVQAGVSFACGLAMNGSVWCWGRNTAGEVGNGVRTITDTAAEVDTLDGPAAVLGVGGTHACVALRSGAMRCWGSGAFGQLGTGTDLAFSETPVAVALPADTTIVEIGGGGGHTCARADDGEVLCWGLSTQRQAGLMASTNTPTVIPALSPATEISARANVTCAVLAEGPVCLGDNTFGSLGRGTVGGAELLPARPMGLSASAQVFPGLASCAIERGRLSCWGDAQRGMLGRSQTVVRPNATNAVNLNAATQLAVGNIAGCAIVSGELRCWGSGGQQASLGVASQAAVSEPLTVAGFAPTQVDIGERGACAIDDSNQAYCWGRNDFSRYGPLASAVFTPTLLPISGTEDEVAISQTNVCVRKGGTVQCAGQNSVGQLGRGATPGDVTMFAPVSGLSDANAIEMGNNFTCARRAGGSLVCWGLGTVGQLGDDGDMNQNVPVPVSGLSRVIDFDLGERHGCAIEAAADGDTFGAVFCWGINGFGAVGAVGATNPQRTPLATPITNAIAVTTGKNHSCAVLQTGRIQCWGQNTNYSVGDGTTNNRFLPVDIGVMADVLNPVIDAGLSGNATCALSAAGPSICWGECYSGSCATGIPMSTGVPAPVAGL